MVERLREMRKGKRERIEKGKRERIEKGSRERIEKRENLKEDLRTPEFSRSVRCSHCFFKSSEYDKLELKHQNVVFTSL